MSEFDFECYKTFDDITVNFSGNFDFKSQFPELGVKPDETILVKLENVGNINSGGVKAWITWIHRLQHLAPNLHFVFYSLPYSFIRLNFQIKNFLPTNRKIISFSAPYHCLGCNSSFKFEFARDRNWDSTWTNPELLSYISSMQCGRCDTVAALDAVPNVFATVV